jgi:Tfp pilus assembly protein FimT
MPTKKRNLSIMQKREFTLKHLLVIVIVMAILTAVAVPFLTDKLEAEREKEKNLNQRSAYAAMVAPGVSDTCGGAWIHQKNNFVCYHKCMHP